MTQEEWWAADIQARAADLAFRTAAEAQRHTDALAAQVIAKGAADQWGRVSPPTAQSQGGVYLDILLKIIGTYPSITQQQASAAYDSAGLVYRRFKGDWALWEVKYG